MTEYNKIGDKIKQIRTEKRLTQEQLAQKVGAEQCSISNIERAKKGSGIDNLDKLAEIGACLEVDVKLNIDGETFPLATKQKNVCQQQIEEFFHHEASSISDQQRVIEEYWKKQDISQDIDVDDFFLKKVHSSGNRLYFGIGSHSLCCTSPVHLNSIDFMAETKYNDITSCSERKFSLIDINAEACQFGSKIEGGILIIFCHIDKQYEPPLKDVIDAYTEIARKISDIIKECNEKGRTITYFPEIYPCIINHQIFIPQKIEYTYSE